MIAEIPALRCVGNSRPFRTAIARAAFHARFHVARSSQQASVTMGVTGVGFFDTMHGRNRATKNGILLHPVLANVSHAVTPTPADS